MTTEDFVAPSQNIHATDIIISKYEDCLNKKISSKILASQKSGKLATFTDEETSYLSKKAVNENPNAPIDIEASSPDVTLKKGNTEIKIKRAAEILKKMDEKYPLGVNNDSKENILRQPYINKSIEYGLSNQIEESDFQSMPIQIVNKNAYEIRADVLSFALDWIKWQVETNIAVAAQSNKKLMFQPEELSSDKVLEVAKKFYAFVENRRF